MSLLVKSLGVSIQMKAIEQYVPVMLFIMLHNVVLFLSLDEILKCAHSNESYWVVLSCGTVYCAVQDKVVLTFEYVDQIHMRAHSNTVCVRS